MALAKSAVTVQASASNTAGSTTTASSVDLTAAYGGVLTAKITNGGTGPTVACSCYLEISHDNSAWKTFGVFTGGTANSGTYESAWEIPIGVQYLRTRFTGNTGQTVTVEAILSKVTGL